MYFSDNTDPNFKHTDFLVRLNWFFMEKLGAEGVAALFSSILSIRVHENQSYMGEWG